MTSTDLSVKSFSFNKDDLRILYSIINVALKNEACKSNSFSRVRKFFQAEETNFEEIKRYRELKLNWIKEWKMEICSLIDIGDVYSESDLKSKITIEPNKKNIFIVELSTFLPYTDLSQDKRFPKLRFDKVDRENYFGACAKLISCLDNEKFHRAFNSNFKCEKKITEAITGPSRKWLWVAGGASFALITAPFLAPLIGSAIGAGTGAAATSAGLAFLGGGSLAAGGLGMTGGYFSLMAGGAILGYSSSSKEYKNRLRKSSKEELLRACSKLYSVCMISKISNTQKQSICKEVLDLQSFYEEEADKGFNFENEDKKGADTKSLILSNFRKLLRGG